MLCGRLIVCHRVRRDMAVPALQKPLFRVVYALMRTLKTVEHLPHIECLVGGSGRHCFLGKVSCE